jgi:hypothetical protein
MNTHPSESLGVEIMKGAAQESAEVDRLWSTPGADAFVAV